MSAEVPLIYDDCREIKAIWFPGEDAGGYSVGSKNYSATKIVAYKEHGQMDFVPFFAVYDGDHLECRIPAHMVMVVYASPALAKADPQP